MLRSFHAFLGVSFALAASPASALATPRFAQVGPDPVEVRRVAEEAGLAPLSEVAIPRPGNLALFLNPGARARKSLVVLGKALFWDMQVGSDGQACASCHFQAGADNRTKNQISPALKHTNPLLQGIFDPTLTGGGGPNYELTAADYPFYKLLVPDERNFDERVVLFETDDVVSSQGVSQAEFEGLSGTFADLGEPLADGIFSVGGVNTRRVEPRNTPTMINAVFNFANFWDGRAHNIFNGVSVIGPLDPAARIHVLTPGGTLEQRAIEIPNSSLASQSVGPPLSSEEMSFLGRTLPEVGRKLLGLRPLDLQLVHPRDSVLGALARTRLGRTGEVLGNPGLNTTYRAMIQAAFRPIYWASAEDVGGFSQMEANFSLFFGLAIQAYETTLVSDASPFDEFMAGDDGALEPEQLLGLLAFIRRPAPRSSDPVFTAEIGVGNCVACHAGPEFTEAAFTSLAAEGELELLEVEEMPELELGNLVVGDETAFLDVGFSNIGVRPTAEDLGRGAEVNGFPLSFARQALLGLEFAPELPECGGLDQEICPEAERVAADGTFKVPGLRNVALTGPYFHNGGEASLEDVVEFYDRRGNYGDDNIADLERNMARITITELDEDPLVAFLESLTDERVAWEMGPFDHPQLFVPNGHPGDHLVVECANGIVACDDVLVVPPIGRFGRAAAGLEELEPFLGLGEEE
ncbi:MAG: cytochrome C peroxidase [Planctomycetes bacterium]|nr:cytochrome C peroxidase [Planctomycetota bacterium]